MEQKHHHYGAIHYKTQNAILTPQLHFIMQTKTFSLSQACFQNHHYHNYKYKL
jgi:hypothetical protein